MITDLLLQAALVVVQGIWALVPSVSFTVPTEWTNLVSQLSLWDSIAPFHELLDIVVISMQVWTGLIALKWSVKIADWIMDVIP